MDGQVRCVSLTTIETMLLVLIMELALTAQQGLIVCATPVTLETYAK